MTKLWKPLRIIVSLIILLSVIAVFIDFKQVFASQWYTKATYLQFLPSLIKFFSVAGLISAGFIIVLILTLLFGRVYCSTICPLGIFQDIVSFLSKKLRTKKFRFKYAKANNILRYTFLGLAILPVLFGSIYILYLLDPYSNFGRFVSDLGRPLYIKVNNLLASILIKHNVYSVSPYDIVKFDWLTIIFPAIMLVVVVWLSLTRGRLYCNTVCPVGTFLGLVSKISIFKLKFDESKCTKCAKCAFACKSQCISIKDQTVDFSRCVGCFNCLNVCDNNSINYKLSLPKKKETITLDEGPADPSKRNFIAGSVLLAGAMIGLSKLAKAQETSSKTNELPEPASDEKRTNHVKIDRKNYCTPPGSKSISHFKDACTACHLCVSACPNGVIQPSLFEYGVTGMLQPYMDYRSGFCNYECTKCGHVCPTGAILPLTHEEKVVTQMGVALFIKTNCIVYVEETACGSCSEHCPTQAVSMVKYKGELTIPHVTPEICVGCGACEKVCPAKPNKAIYIEGNPIQQVAHKPEIKKADDKKLENFAF
ncbi:MAG: 4Fe-4S binding protein [Bacteroidota bacterium]|nr:4Fe-4S binding protein [Bacteroidota bacterium]